ncbi:MAG: ribonuclease M5 [Eubacteriaceae bacterium]|nr:ribonuclease M5 [Eubacteriaceae bacterium]
MTTKEHIREIIVVEGRDDTAAVRRAVDAETIETHGFGIRKETWELIEKAENTPGIIIFTDPDHAGEQIRNRITDRFPGSKQAFLDRTLAMAGDDIGIENAKPGDIAAALKKAKAERKTTEDIFTMEDMWQEGLAGIDGAADARRDLGKKLGIGYGNAAAFLRRLNTFGINREDFYEALRRENDKRTE